MYFIKLIYYQRTSFLLSYTMAESMPLIFKVPSQSNSMLDVSNVPREATIFYHRNKWWYELKTRKTLNDELCKRESVFTEFDKLVKNQDFPLGPFGEKISFSLYSLYVLYRY